MVSPVYAVQAVPVEKIRANSYNPNSVAPPEMALLEISIWEDGYTPEQVAVISYHGVKSSEVLAQDKLGGYKTKKFSVYDAAGNALWTDGALLVDSVYRYKGQSMPVVVLCEIDFDELTEKDKRKLFVGLTRGQVRIDLVMSEKSTQLILQSW